MIDLLLPRTDAGVALQVVVATVLFTSAAVAVRRHRELLVFVLGLATMTAAWFALRAVH